MKLELLQKQKMVMTPDLNQAITMLQYSTVEMEQFIQEQAMENPLIELEENNHEISFKEDVPISKSQSNFSSHHSEVNPLDYLKSEEKGMWEHLLQQAQFLDIEETERTILRYLILNLDENGYLPLSTLEISQLLNVPEQEAISAIDLLQQLEPAGVGARGLKECLLLQLRTYHPNERMTEQVITDYLELVANNKWKEIASCFKISLEEVKSIVTLIQSLDPKPCADIYHVPVRYQVPDIIIEKVKDKYTISLNDKFTPTINMNKQYTSYLGQNNETSHYLKKHYQKYLWLVNSIEQRRATILKITEVMVDKQIDFLNNGTASLKPLTLKDVAEEIDVHESTVSRATKNKVIQTPKGTFELRMFFSSKLGKDEIGTSTAKVKALLKQLVKNENKRKPLSDQKISAYFSDQEGVKVSRRTISKYREELNILSSSKRKGSSF
ncbi:RNA polymerase factor sigma-54 [Halobacillus shinanisalinarum]|uniref:RNA polymerase factor sigma-54 n=1 Tax=Halobacillus shinanisalinarum TaxID=2932258 RepID=A0ABY4H3X3_9BACI|nr:RNA polymerase factor sigma-54 [Halobacillus shinanisalinarum]UOQ94610.1 RNA polymerase factor sigma-54 [Halobacillus shinanisalinarum]